VNGHRIDPELSWAVEAGGVTVSRGLEGVQRTIGYPAAALWDFVARGYGFERCVRMVRHIGGFADEGAATEFVSQQLTAWLTTGLIVRKEG
jgi:hypothetical protein